MYSSSSMLVVLIDSLSLVDMKDGAKYCVLVWENWKKNQLFDAVVCDIQARK